MSFSTGDSELKVSSARITYDEDVTIEQVVREASGIYKEFRRRKLDINDFDACDKFITEQRKAHKAFAEAYPIVLRYICQMGEFHARALEKYIRKIQQHPWNSEEGYVDSQCDYVVLLYKEKHPKWNKTYVESLRRGVHKMLSDEHKKFRENGEKFQKEVEEDEAEYKTLREAALHEFYSTFGAETTNIEVRGESDIPMDELPSVDNTPVAPTGPTVDDLLA